MEGAGGDEQDMVGAHHAVFGGDGTALDQRQQVALHPFAGDIGALAFGTPGDLVHFVEKDDAVLFHQLHRAGLDLFLVEQLGGLLIDQLLERVLNAHLALFGTLVAQVLKQALQLVGHLFHTGRRHDLHPDRGGTQFDLDLLVVQIALAQFLAEFLPGAGFGLSGGRGRFVGKTEAAAAATCRWQQDVEDAVFSGLEGAMLYLLHLDLTHHFHRDIDEIAHDRLYIATNIAHFGEFGRLDLDERCLGQFGQATGDLGLANPGRADHQDVLGGDLVAQCRVYLTTTPAITQRDSHRALGIGLADDVFVEFLNDLAWGHLRHGFTVLLPLNNRGFRW